MDTLLFILILSPVVLPYFLADFIVIKYFFKAEGRILWITWGISALSSMLIFTPVFDSLNSIIYGDKSAFLIIDFLIFVAILCLVKTFIIKKLLPENSYLKIFPILFIAFAISMSLGFTYMIRLGPIIPG